MDIANASSKLGELSSDELQQFAEFEFCYFCPIENLLCMKKILRQTVWLKRMKVNLIIFDVRFIF